MRTLNPTLALASVFGFLMAASCTLITDVDRTKIPTDAGPQGGETATGGTGGKGGSSGKGGKGGAGGTSGTGTGGTGGVEPACSHAEGSITLDPGVLFADGESITIGDGLSDPVVFEMNYVPAATAVASGHVAIDFDGEPTNVEFATWLAVAIEEQGDALRVAAEIETISMAVTGSGGQAGASGSGSAGENTSGSSNGGAPNAGSGGSGPVTPGSVRINLSNELAGALGNVKIVKKAGNPKIKVSGMSGGKSVACSAESSCTTDAECASGDCGSDSICAL